MTSPEKIAAARELLAATKRNIQLTDNAIASLQGGRSAVEPASDVSSEHQVGWLSAVDDLDQDVGIEIGDLTVATSFGFQNMKTGTIRNRADSAFVVTNILTAVGYSTDSDVPFERFIEAEYQKNIVPMLRLKDGATGRSLVTGMTQMPLDRDRGAVPFSYFSSIRKGLGSNVKNSLFSEFTIPRNGVVRAEVFNAGVLSSGDQYGDLAGVARVCITLLGYKVYGG